MSKRMVNLYDGTPVSSDSEEWRAECEARDLARQPREVRAARLEGVQAKRGVEARKALHQLAIALYKAGKA